MTKLENLINPEVMGPMINAKIEALAKITPYAKVDTTLVGVPGDTKTVPSWKYIGDAVDVAEGEEVELSTLEASSTTFTIKKAMKSVGITDEAVNSGLGNPIGQAETQLAKSIMGKVDNDVLDAAYSSKNVYDGSSSAIGYKPIVEGVGKFEDEEDDIDKVMFIHPKQETTLLKDDDFISADKFEAGVAIRGSIGKIAGCWVKKSKKVILVQYEKAASGSITIVDDETAESSTAMHLSTVQKGCISVLDVGDKVNSLTATKQYYACPIIKLEPDSPETEETEDELPAISIFLKKDTTVETDRYPRKQTTEVTAARYYGVALTNEGKVVVAKFKA